MPVDPPATSVQLPTTDGPAELNGAAAGRGILAGEDPTGELIISELMYHPVDGDPANEFVEVLNRSARTIDLEGWCLQGVKACLGQGSLQSGSFLSVPTLGTNSALSNGGEEIGLVDPAGDVVDIVEYDDRDQWPAMADGDGLSLQRRDPNSSGSNPGNWIAETPTPGTAAVSTGPPLPTWSDVTFTRLPSPGAAVEVSGVLDDSKDVAEVGVEYVLGFGAPATVSASVDASGRVNATVPGQPAGSLVRLRLVATTAEG